MIDASVWMRIKVLKKRKNCGKIFDLLRILLQYSVIDVIIKRIDILDRNAT